MRSTYVHGQLIRTMLLTLLSVRLLVVKLRALYWVLCTHELLSEAAGQRCMAISVVVLVGDAYEWLPDLVNLAKKLKVGGGFEKDVDL